MKYVGSKNKIAKYIVPIVQSYIDKGCNGVLIPFCGGANIEDKLKHDNIISSDINEYLIELLIKTRDDFNNLPLKTTKDEYIKIKNNKKIYPKWLVGLYEFCASYNSKSWAGYCGDCKTKQGIRHYDQEAIRNLIKQAANLKGIKFECRSYLDIDRNINGYVIYCDPPYRDTTKYKTGDFDYDTYYQWVRDMSKNNIVICSEYWMPDDFTCIWQKEVRMSLDKNSSKQNRIEKLYIYEAN